MPRNYCWRGLYEHMLDGFALHEIILDEEGRPVDYRFVEVNPSFERITGLRAAEIIGRTVLDVLPETEALWIERYGRVALTGEATHFESYSHNLGRHFEVMAYCPSPGRFACHFRDVTDRVRMLECLTRINDTLIHLPGDFRADVEALLSLCGELLAADSLHYLRNEDGKIDEFYRWHADGRSGDVRNDCPEEIRFCYELLEKLGDSEPSLRRNEAAGKNGTIRCMGIPIRRREFTIGTLCLGYSRDFRPSELDRRIFGIIASALRQLEERRHLEQQIRHVQKLESLGVLAGGIAHDFNNLLTGIIGNTDLALQQIPATSQARPALEDVFVSARRAGELCRQLLAYSGKGRFVRQNIQLSSFVNDMVEMIRVSLGGNCRLRLDLAETLPVVVAVPAQLQQVVLNLIINAAEAMEGREGNVSIRTALEDCDAEYLRDTYIGHPLPPGPYVVCEVSDTGCGMDNETRRRLFDPFFSTKFTGRGLGLAAVLGILKGHRGSVKVYSEPGRGTTMKVLLPAAVGEAESPKPGTAESRPEKLKGRILLVDDEATVRRTARRLLESMGLSVTLAADGREALTAYESANGQFDLVLLDLTMPDMGGEAIFRQLRSRQRELPIVMMSGYNEQEVSQRFSGRNMTGFLQKPFRLADLQEMIRRLLCESDRNESPRETPSPDSGQ